MSKLSFIFILILLPVVAMAQSGEILPEEHGMGLAIDTAACLDIPEQPRLMAGDYTSLPRAVSLRKYCPTPKSQREFGTCTSWASGYAARTIVEAVNNGWTDSLTINSEAFSPLFIYGQIKNSGDLECRLGTSPDQALRLLKDKGCAKLKSFDVYCADYISQDLMDEASNFKIDDYFTLFNSNEHNADIKTAKVKKALSEKCPVVISMDIYPSFGKDKPMWNGDMTLADGESPGLHAMTVVGYDDDRSAFQIMNSWGPNWCDGGFIWVRYADFAKTVGWAWQIYLAHRQEQQACLSGSLEMQLATGEIMQPTLVDGDVPHYRIKGSFTSGTRYRAYISNNEPAYVYMIGSDQQNNVSKVFPPRNGISPALVYKSSHIAIPDEKFYIQLDNTVGTDYMCVLYSADPLDIDGIIARLRQQQGDFYSNLARVIGDQMADKHEIDYKADHIDFKAKTSRKIVPLLVEFAHR